tara:strand:+ start:449 stop:703 length:255 start_codon:yes stop_codon:yes gene_type:complete
MQVTLILARHNNRVDILGHELVNNDNGISLHGTSRKRKECERMHGKRVDMRMKNERMEHSQRVAEMKGRLKSTQKHSLSSCSPL